MRYVHVIGGLLTVALAITGCARVPAPPRRPNVVIVLLDAVRADHATRYGQASRESQLSPEAIEELRALRYVK